MKCSMYKRSRNLPEHLSDAAGLKLVKICGRGQILSVFPHPCIKIWVLDHEFREHHLCLQKTHTEEILFSDLEQNVGSSLLLENLSKRFISDELLALLVMYWKHTALCKASKWCGVHHPVMGRVLDSLKAGLRSDIQVGFSFRCRHAVKPALFAKATGWVEFQKLYPLVLLIPCRYCWQIKSNPSLLFPRTVSNHMKW